MSPRGGGVRLKTVHGGALRFSTGKLKGKAGEVSGNVWRYLVLLMSFHSWVQPGPV